MLSRGSVVFSSRLSRAALLAAVTEAANEGNDPKLPVRIGFVVTDCPTGEIVAGQFADDELRSRLRAHLTG